jgi:hypothetical protein
VNPTSNLGENHFSIQNDESSRLTNQNHFLLNPVQIDAPATHLEPASDALQAVSDSTIPQGFTVAQLNQDRLGGVRVCSETVLYNIH